MHNRSYFITQLQSTGWIIDARWYYAPLAFFLGIIAREDVADVQSSAILAGALLVVLACNTLFYLYLRRLELEKFEGGEVTLLNIAQIGLDILFFFVITLFTGGGADSVGQSFFFIPIIVSTSMFGFRGAASVASASGVFILISVLAHWGVLEAWLRPDVPLVLSRELSLALTQAGIIFLVYLLVGFFGGYISRLIRARDLLLLEKISKEEEQVRRLEELTKKFDESAKLLVRRDLELTKANEKLTELDKMKSEIVSVVTHQLRTPLSAIKWTLKLLLNEDVGKVVPAQRELLLKGFESNERMIILVNDMLSVDRLESGKVKYNFVPIQFEQLTQEMIQELLPIATPRNIRIEFTAPKELLPKIKIDPEKIRDVLQNLIDNAIKYTKENGMIAIGVEMADDQLHFWIKDTGIGIPEEEKEKIFSRFFRAGNAVHTQTDGSGLGLFIASSIVKRHGGKIWFESAPGEGTTFHVRLPFAA